MVCVACDFLVRTEPKMQHHFPRSPSCNCSRSYFWEGLVATSWASVGDPASDPTEPFCWIQFPELAPDLDPDPNLITGLW